MAYRSGVKMRISAEELYQIQKSPNLRVFSTPFAPGKVIIGSLAFGRGKVPKPLKNYVGQTAKVAKACEGKRGYAFVVCLRNKAKEMGITGGGKKKAR